MSETVNAGSISVIPAMATALRRGYGRQRAPTPVTRRQLQRAAATAEWAVGTSEPLVDFGYRAIHVTAENAKRVVQSFYSGSQRATWLSTRPSGHGAQRFPEDYDGVIAGDPAANWTRFYSGHLDYACVRRGSRKLHSRRQTPCDLRRRQRRTTSRWHQGRRVPAKNAPSAPQTVVPPCPCLTASRRKQPQRHLHSAHVGRPRGVHVARRCSQAAGTPTGRGR